MKAVTAKLITIAVNINACGKASAYGASASFSKGTLPCFNPPIVNMSKWTACENTAVPKIIRIIFLERIRYVATATRIPINIIINVSIRYPPSSLMLKIIVTNTPTTVKATPASNMVTVVSSVTPKIGKSK